jgi:hypothetical protein
MTTDEAVAKFQMIREGVQAMGATLDQQQLAIDALRKENADIAAAHDVAVNTVPDAIASEIDATIALLNG